jgi:DNA repair protein SbcC/Rad50
MRKVKIKSLSLVNFKGIKSLEIKMTDVTRIYGDNSTGKTSLVDAFTWLLFGKDSQDKKDFSIKTLDAKNNVIHKLDHEVTGVLTVDNVETTLRRCYKEKWVTRRGSAEAELQGHETLFFWNDVPLQANEYQAKVNDILEEGLFKLITSPIYFNSQKWQDRRNILISISGNIDDSTVAAKRKEFQRLLDKMQGKSLDEYRKELVMRKKKLRAELDTIPARIDEQDRSKPESKDWKAIQDEIDILKNNMDNIDSEIADESKKYQGVYTQRSERQKRIGDLRLAISNCEFKARQNFNNQLNDKQTNIDAIKVTIRRIESDIQQAQKYATDNQNRIAEITNKIVALRAEWGKVNAEYLTISDSDEICPTCKQHLPEDSIAEKRETMLANFTATKAQRLADISAQGKKLKAQADDIKVPAESEADSLEQRLREAHESLTIAEKYEIKTVAAILANDTAYHEAKKELESLEAAAEMDVPNENRDLKLKRSGYQDRINILSVEIGKKDQIKICEDRIEELKRQESVFAQQLADLESDEFVISEFVRAKVDMLESKINGMFTGVQFKLFDTQLNGGLVECCDTLITGVPWQDANNAAKINAGIEIINVLSDYYGVSAPIWIDNAESITSINRTSAQRIELYVSEADKTLRVN